MQPAAAMQQPVDASEVLGQPSTISVPLRNWLTQNASFAESRVQNIVDVLDKESVDSVADLAAFSKLSSFEKALPELARVKITAALAAVEPPAVRTPLPALPVPVSSGTGPIKMEDNPMLGAVRAHDGEAWRGVPSRTAGSQLVRLGEASFVDRASALFHEHVDEFLPLCMAVRHLNP